VTRDGRIWWQGYKDEEVILFDDYRGETGFSEMLRVTHEHQYVGDVKGTDATVNSACVIFTSNEPFTMWKNWKDYDKSPFERRLTDHFQMSWEKPSGHTIKPEDVIRLDNGCYVHIIKGKFGIYADPPNDGAAENGPGDEEVEEHIAQDFGNWLPKRRRPAAAGQEEDDAAQGLANLLKTPDVNLGDLVGPMDP